jgi:hypothetical protein
MLQIDFSSNPNGKLLNDHFGEIRLKSASLCSETECEILFKHQSIGFANITSIRNFPINRLSDAAAYLNCGKSAAYQVALLNRYYNGGKPMPPDTMLSHLILSWTKRDIPAQEELFKDFWKSNLLNHI